jgi:hypothetical protein
MDSSVMTSSHVVRILKRTYFKTKSHKSETGFALLFPLVYARFLVSGIKRGTQSEGV